jgi:RNA polymerase primary sigma factor
MALHEFHEAEPDTPDEFTTAMADTVSPVGPLGNWSSADDHPSFRDSTADGRENDDTAGAIAFGATEDHSERALLRQYIREVSRFSLLGPKRELELARTIREGQEDLIKLILGWRGREGYLRDLAARIRVWREKESVYPGLRDKMVSHIMATLLKVATAPDGPESAKRLLGRARRINETIAAAKKSMAEGNLRLVLSMVRRYRGRGLGVLDLIQEGNIGLLKAVSRYDYRKGNRFSTYATWWVRQGIIRAIYDKSRTVRLPLHLIEMRIRYLRTRRQLERELGREPTMEEIAGRSGMPTERLLQIVAMSKESLHLEAPVGDDDQRLADLLAAEGDVSPLDLLSKADLSTVTQQALKCLTQKEGEILKLRFGIDGQPAQTLKSIGKVFLVSKERVRQIEHKAIGKLRRTSYRDELRYFLE